MSGTSLDAIDAAACEFDDEGRLRRLVGTHTEPYDEALQRELLRLQRAPDTPLTLRDVARLDAAVGEAFALAAAALLGKLGLPPSAVLAVGSHGQTVLHDPQALGTSLQLGDPNRIAARTGICTVADFRRADMVRGGQGAPLVPAFHQAVFGQPGRARVVANIGGIANITVLPAEDDAEVTGFDTGPGNALLDDWAQHALQRPFDEDGAWAAQGRVDAALLEELLADPYFRRRPPKSTGRDSFNLAWLRGFARLQALNPKDVQRTLLELTVESLARAIEAQAPGCAEVLVCGGGARNRQLMQGLADRLAPAAVCDTRAAGLDPAWIEAAAFAWLAWRTLKGKPGNLPGVTGATRSAVLGGVYAA